MSNTSSVKVSNVTKVINNLKAPLNVNDTPNSSSVIENCGTIKLVNKIITDLITIKNSLIKTEIDLSNAINLELNSTNVINSSQNNINFSLLESINIINNNINTIRLNTLSSNIIQNIDGNNLTLSELKTTRGEVGSDDVGFILGTGTTSNRLTEASIFTILSEAYFLVNSLKNGSQININNVGSTTITTDASTSTNSTNYVMTYTITLGNNGTNNIYVLNDGTGDVNNPALTLTEYGTYRFDYSSLEAHPFKLSTTSDGTHSPSGSEYTTNVTTTNNILYLLVDSETPTTLYYYCVFHPGMGNSITISIT